MYHYPSELYHFGILGQKWGIRRYQNPDGTLTAEGRQRYGYGNEYTGGKSALSTKKAVSETYKALSRNSEIAEKKPGVVKRLIQNHHDNLVNAYKKKGMSDEEAEKAANKRMRAEAVVAGVAAVGVATIAASAVYRKYMRDADHIIKAGATLNRIGLSDGPASLHDVFFASNTAGDKNLYGGQLGLTRYAQGYLPKSMDISVSKNVKVAGLKTVEKTWDEISKTDPKVREWIAKARLDTNFQGTKKGSVVEKLIGYAPDDRVNIDIIADQKKVFKRYRDYEGLKSFSESERIAKFINRDKLRDRLYTALKEKGYSGFIDANDAKISDYHAAMPLVMLNDKSEFSIKSVQNLPIAEARTRWAVDTAKRIMPPLMAEIGGLKLVSMLTEDTAAIADTNDDSRKKKR